MDARTLVGSERRDLHAFLATLTPEEWEHPTLCEGWRVRDVVSHLIVFDEGGVREVLGDFVRSGFNPDRTNARGVRRRRGRTPEELLDALERQFQPSRLSRIMKGVPVLVDSVVHHQDIRRPLGRPREVPADRLRIVLTALKGDRFVGGRRRAKGLRLVATDLDWSAGDGPEVRGPGETLALALAGRKIALEDFAGDGLEEFAARP